MKVISSHTEDMTEKTNQIIKKSMYIVGIAIAVYFGMRFILPVVIPFLIAFFLAWVLHKPVDFGHQKLHIPRGIMSILCELLFMALILTPVIWLVYKGVCELGMLLANRESLLAQANVLWCSCCNRIEQISGIEAAGIEQFVREQAGRMIQQGQEKLLPCIMNMSMASFKGAAGVLGKIVVTLVAAVLILNDYHNLVRYIRKSKVFVYFTNMSEHMRYAGGTYIKAQLIIIGIITLICVAGLFATGNSYAIVIGILIGLCDALPFIGTGLILVPWLIFEVFRGNYWLAFLYGAMYIACSFVREYVEPKLVGKGLGVHPLLIIISIYAGLKVYGIGGVILGPLSAFLIWELYQKLNEE